MPLILFRHKLFFLFFTTSLQLIPSIAISTRTSLFTTTKTAAAAAKRRGSTVKMGSSTVNSFYDLKPFDSKHEPFEFSRLKGKVVLIVNVASKCGFTQQYEGLEKLYETYKDKGLEVIGFPCNQFGGQEPGSQEEIQEFCTVNYGIKFPILEKIDVNGANASPIYEYLKREKPGLLGIKSIKWNYEKFLISRDGKVVDRWASTTKPEALKSAVERELAKPQEVEGGKSEL